MHQIGVYVLQVNQTDFGWEQFRAFPFHGTSVAPYSVHGFTFSPLIIFDVKCDERDEIVPPSLLSSSSPNETVAQRPEIRSERRDVADLQHIQDVIETRIRTNYSSTHHELYDTLLQNQKDE